MKKKSIIEISYKELEKLVKEKLGYKNYCFVAVEECGNDSDHQFDVDGEIDDFDLEDIKSWEEGKFVNYSNGIILNKLCADGHIEKGDYVVTVCW